MVRPSRLCDDVCNRGPRGSPFAGFHVTHNGNPGQTRRARRSARKNHLRRRDLVWPDQRQSFKTLPICQSRRETAQARDTVPMSRHVGRQDGSCPGTPDRTGFCPGAVGHRAGAAHCRCGSGGRQATRRSARSAKTRGCTPRDARAQAPSFGTGSTLAWVWAKDRAPAACPSGAGPVVLVSDRTGKAPRPNGRRALLFAAGLVRDQTNISSVISASVVCSKVTMTPCARNTTSAPSWSM